MGEDDTVLAMERAALERWCRGDPSGFLEISASEVVYFDPFLPRRLDGLAALRGYYESLRGKVSAARFELRNPMVTVAGEIALLSFNFVSWGYDGGESCWNCTEAYRKATNGWRIIQSHWSLTGKVH